MIVVIIQIAISTVPSGKAEARRYCTVQAATDCTQTTELLPPPLLPRYSPRRRIPISKDKEGAVGEYLQQQ